MGKNRRKEEQEVLLVVAKTDDNQLKFVKSSAKTEIMKSLLPGIDNLEDFMKIDKHSNMPETFSTNFMQQSKKPTDFRFYHLPVTLLDKLNILRDMLKSPEKNKDFLAQYEVNPEDYIMTCPKIALHSNNYKKCTSYVTLLFAPHISTPFQITKIILKQKNASIYFLFSVEFCIFVQVTRAERRSAKNLAPLPTRDLLLCLPFIVA